MRLNEIEFNGAEVIEGYGPGFFRIGGEVYEGAVLVGPGGVRPWGGFEDTATPLGLKGEIDVLFVGTGAEIAHLPAAFRAAVEAPDLGIEAMASPAACRTYNVLLSEGRRIALALIPV